MNISNGGISTSFGVRGRTSHSTSTEFAKPSGCQGPAFSKRISLKYGVQSALDLSLGP